MAGWVAPPSAVRLIEPHDAATEAADCALCTCNVRAPALIVIGTFPEGDPSVMSSVPAPELRDSEATWTFGFSFSANTKWRFCRKLPLACEMLNVALERSSWTWGCAPEYSICARYRSVPMSEVAESVTVADPALISIATLFRLPTLSAQSCVCVAEGLGASAT